MDECTNSKTNTGRNAKNKLFTERWRKHVAPFMFDLMAFNIWNIQSNDDI